MHLTTGQLVQAMNLKEFLQGYACLPIQAIYLNSPIKHDYESRTCLGYTKNSLSHQPLPVH